MKHIELIDTLPNVFTNRVDICSDIWKSNTTFDQGSHYLIEAASGTGKSSLCSYIYGSRCDYRGIIKFDNNNISSFSQDRWNAIRKNNISILFQDLKLFSEFTSIENVELKNRLTNFKKRAEIIALFEELDIADKIDIPVGKLSFGQQQRVAFIRALCQPYNFILLDEAISHLDTKNSATVAKIALCEANRQGASIISTSVGVHLPLPYNKILKLSSN